MQWVLPPYSALLEADAHRCIRMAAQQPAYLDLADTKERAVRISDGVMAPPVSSGGEPPPPSSEGMVASRRTSCRRRHSSSTCRSHVIGNANNCVVPRLATVTHAAMPRFCKPRCSPPLATPDLRFHYTYRVTTHLIQ